MEKSARIIELSLELADGSEPLLAWLRERGIEDMVEASCDFLDSECAEPILEGHTAGRLNLPTLIYSYDRPWVEALKEDLLAAFGTAIRIGEKVLADELWQEAWQEDFAYLATERFLIAPLGHRSEHPELTLIQLQPGTVFGSGQHATTQALIRLLEREAPLPGLKFLDVGTGTGVLSLVAHHLGFASICGTDIEATAISDARANQEINGIVFDLIEGSLPPERDKFDCVVCNILPPTLTHMLSALVERLNPGGRLYLAGMHEANEEEVLKELKAHALQHVASHRERGWTARLYQREK